MAGAFGTVMVTSIIGMPPRQIALMAWRASSRFAARTTGTMPISLIRLIVSSRAMRPLLELRLRKLPRDSFLGKPPDLSRSHSSGEAPIGIDEEPCQRAKRTQEGGGQKRGVPAKSGGDDGGERSGYGAAQLRTHVHEAGCG